MRQPTLSIITINLNNREGLHRTITSVIEQTFSNFEWIVIDGGSTDGSLELIEQCAEHFSYYVSEPDLGIYNAMNKGIAHANGKWLQFLNSGDALYEKSTLAKVFESEHKDADIVYGDCYLEYGHYGKMKYHPDDLSLSFFFQSTINHQCTFYRQELFRTYRYTEQYTIISDWIAYFHFVFDGCKFHHVKIPIARFDTNGISNSHTDKRENERKMFLDTAFPLIVRRDIDTLIHYNETLNRLKSHRSTSILLKLLKALLTFLQRMQCLLGTVKKTFRTHFFNNAHHLNQ